MHIKSSHSQIKSKKLRSSTKILNEDISLHEISAASITIDENHEDVVEKPSVVDKGILSEHIGYTHKDIRTNKSFRSSALNVSNPLEVVEENVHCTGCDFSVKSVTELESHIKSTHTNTGDILLVHNSPPLIHQERESIIICGVCSKGFEDEKAFNGHLQEHTGKQSIKCDKCKIVLISVTDLEWHMETEHVSPTKQDEIPLSITCPFCKLETKSKSTLDVHIQNIHHKEQAKNQDIDNIKTIESETCFKCNDCVVTGNAVELSNHINVIHKRVEICSFCGNNFPDIQSLQKHTISKHAPEPFPCEICGLELTNFPLLQEHIAMIHTTKSESCRFCDFTAADTDTLETHLVEAHEEVIILHSSAKQLDVLTQKMCVFETFGADITKLLETVLWNQNAIKQELFLLRNNQQSQNSSKANDIPSQACHIPPQPAASSSPLSPPPRSWSSPRPSTSGPTTTTEKHDNQPKILYVGDSVGMNVNLEAIEDATQSHLVTAKAFSSVYDDTKNEAKEPSKHPAANFKDVVAYEIAKNKYKALVLQAGSVDVSNLNTKDEPTKYIDYFKQEVVQSANNLFHTATDALRTQPTLTKVVIMKQTPRYDPLSLDPLSLKPALAMLFNNTLTDLWMNCTDKDKIFVGSHNIECSGPIKESRYRHTKSGKYDGVHLYGSSGQKAYTMSVLNILRSAKLTSEDYEYHFSCPQYKYQNRKQDNRHTKSQNIKVSSVPTYNRFQKLNNNFQGNW